MRPRKFLMRGSSANVSPPRGTCAGPPIAPKPERATCAMPGEARVASQQQLERVTTFRRSKS